MRSNIERLPFLEVFKKAYGWTVDDEGYLAGLVAGDMGYEETDKKLIDLIGEAYMNGDHHEDDWKTDDLFNKLVEHCCSILKLEKEGFYGVCRTTKA